MKARQRKTVELDWRDDLDTVKGMRASISADEDGTSVEVRNVENDGLATVTFPTGYTGTCKVTVAGSKSGEVSVDVKVT